jgi:murein DD-endopeptidase MepM/ murein hydrolase activator NlpD
MRAVTFLTLVLLLAGCSGTPSTPQMPFATETIAAALTSVHLPRDQPPPTAIVSTVPPTATSVASTSTLPAVIAPTDAPTATAVVLTPTLPAACDPVTVDYCIVAGHFIFNRPIFPPGNDYVEPTYRYGATQNGFRDPHHGVEFPNATGTPVHAAADGQVVFAGSDTSTPISPWPNAYGNAVVIEHSYNGLPIFTVYGHLSKVDVQSGQRVSAGEMIGEVGATGAAIGSHLHFEVRQGENQYTSTRNPELWLIPRDGQGTLAIRVSDETSQLVPVRINVQYVLDDGTREQVVQPEAYSFKEKYKVASDDVYGENFGFGDLRAGTYRLSFVRLGKLYQRLVEVIPDRLTLVDFTIN